MVVGDEVVHDAVVADAEAVEGVGLAADRFHLFAADAAGSSDRGGELLEVGADSLPERCGEFLEGSLGRRSQTDVVGVAQAMSRSAFVRPRR